MEVGSVMVVREFDKERDRARVEEVERRCEVGPTAARLSIFTDLLGDPICRVRNSPAFLMLVAEMGSEKEIVGVIRGSIKTVTCAKKLCRTGTHCLNSPAKPLFIPSLLISWVVESLLPTRGWGLRRRW